MAKIIEIEGYGSAKAGGSSSGPVEAPNTLQSRAVAKLVDLLVEGPIKGLKDADDGRKSVILNKVAVVNPDGTENYKGFKYALLTGTSDQVALPGFTSIATEQDVGRRVRADTPVIYTTSSAYLTAIVATVAIPALTKQDKKSGDLNGYNVTIAIDVRSLSNPDNLWVTVFDGTNGGYIQGKNTATYERSYRISVSGPGPWQVRMRRLSADNDSDVTISDKTLFSHVTEIIEHQIAYSDSAVCGIEVDAEQFGTNLAERAYDAYLQEIEYPSNYDPETREYTGFWDGTFHFGWCNNPAWVFRTLATHPRFGADVDPAFVDKWSLYQLAKFCDELVPDGFGGMEPRFVFNGLIKSQEEAYKVLQSVASMMRAIVFYGAGSVIVRQDRPMDAERNIYTPANIKGDFNYAGTALKVRHNAAVVQWINPALGYDTDYTSYEKKEAIIKYGYNPLNITAIGTTSEGQAYRQGKWAILTEQYQTDTVSFTAGWDSADVLPGDVIEIADPHWATADFAGRVKRTPNALSNNMFLVNPFISGTGEFNNLYKAGPLGARNLAGFVNTGGTAQLIQQRSLPSGTYTFSAYVDRTSHRYVLAYFQVTTTVRAISVDVRTGKVRAKSPGITNAWVEDCGGDLLRICFTITNTNAISLKSFRIGFDSVTTAVNQSSDTLAVPVVSGATLYAGSMQLETGTSAKPYYPYVDTSLGTQVILDRDIDFTGATSPELHLTLLDGSYDDVAGVDNTDRPARRKVTYFSSAISDYNPLTQMVTLTTAIPDGSDDDVTPFIWIFSKQQVQPSKWKVISIKETDKKDFQITAINYSANKFNELDEEFYVTQPDGTFSDLPNTSFCYPPKNVHAYYTTTTYGQVSSATATLSWEASPDKFLRGYVVAMRKDDGNWTTLPMSQDVSVDFTDLTTGHYEFVVRAVSKFGTASAEISTSIDITEVVTSDKQPVTSVYTDAGDHTFTDRDISLFWNSVALSQSAVTSNVSTIVHRKGDKLVGNDADGWAFDPGGDDVSTGTVDVNVSNPAEPTLTVTGTFNGGDQVEARIGFSSYFYDIVDGQTNHDIALGIANVLNNDTTARYFADVTGAVITIYVDQSSANATDLSAHNDPLFKAYRVHVRTVSGGTILRSEDVTAPQFVYTYANNVADNSGSPRRSLWMEVAVVDIYDNVTLYTGATITNPAPAVPSITTEIGTGIVKLRFTPPSDPDYAGVKVWASLTSGFTPNDAANLVYNDRGNPALVVPPGGTLYYRYAFYDAFGMTGVTTSAQFTIAVPAIDASVLDNTPPPLPTLGGSPLTSATATDSVTGLPITKLVFSWNAVVASDLDGYEVELMEGAGGWVGDFFVSKDATSYTFASVKGNVAYTARVRSVDVLGNRSNWATSSAYTTAKDTVAPAVPTGLTATAGFKEIWLAWSNPADSDLAFVEIWQNTSNTTSGATRLTTVFALPSALGKFSVLNATSQLYFWLKAVDTSGNVSTFSTGANATPGALVNSDFTPGLSANETVSSLPSTGNFLGRVVFLSTDGKLYRWNSVTTTGTTYWTTSVATVDLTGTISELQIADAAITSAKLALNSVTSNAIASGAVTDAKIAGMAASKVTGTLTDAQLAAISAAKITGQIITTQISDAGITTPKLATGAVTAATIAANTITAAQIAAQTITSAEIAAGAITTAKLAAGAITASTIAAGAITTEKMTLVAGNLVANSDFATGDFTNWQQWSNGTYQAILPNSDASVPASAPSKYVCRYRYTGSAIDIAVFAASKAYSTAGADKDGFAVTPGQQYYVAINMVKSASYAASGPAIFAFFQSADGSYTNSTNVMGLTPTTSWATYQSTFTAPAGALRCWLYIYDPGHTAGDLFWTNLRCWQRAGADLIVDGAITAVKIQAASITGDRMVANTITASQIAANTITAAQIAAGTITATQIASGTITGDRLVAGTITASQIASGAITTDRLAVGSVTTVVIADGVITTAKMTAGTINADRLQSGSITATQIAAGTITGDRLVAGTITADKIAVGVRGASLIVNGGAEAGTTAGWTSVGPNFGASGTLSVNSTIVSGTYAFYASKPTQADGMFFGAKAVPVTPGKIYVVRAKVWGSSSVSSGFYLRLYSNNTLPSSGYIDSSNYGTISDLVGNGAISTGLTAHEYTWTCPANNYWVTVSIGNWNGGPTTVAFDEVELFEQASSVTIADGAITTAKMTAGSINADRLQAGTITATQIAAGTITAAQIASNTITATQIAAGTITGDRIAAGTITADKLLIGSTSGARLVLTTNLIQVYDASNLIRVRLGIW